MVEVDIGGVRLRLDPSESRFWRALGAWLLVLSAATGVAVTLATAHALSPFVPMTRVPSVMALRNLRELGPGAVSSAVTFALVTWGHFLDEKPLRDRCRRGLARAALASVAGLPIAWLTVALASLATTRAAYALPWRDCWSAALQFITPTDFAISVAVLVVEMGAIFGLSFRSLPRLARARWPLPLKLFVAWLFLLLVRLVLIAFVAIAFAEPPL